MMRELIERFRYRFELWCRGRGHDYPPYNRAAAPYGLVHKLAEDPQRKAALTEPTVMFVGRILVSYFGVVGIGAVVSGVVIAFCLSVQTGIIIGLIVFACLWAFGGFLAVYRIHRARADYRESKII